MNYNEYNDRIGLSAELYEKTLSGVKSAVSKHNQIQKRRKTAILSAAACFVVFACSISAVKYLGKNPTANLFEVTVNTPTENSNNDGSIRIKTENSKYPHKIMIDNKIYSQYYFGDEKGDKDNNIELKQSEIGELICLLDYSNLTDDLSNFEPISSEDAKTNKFYKAKAYKYTKAKNDNIIIVQVKNEYYMFYFNGLTTDYTIEELLNVYTAEGTNGIACIEIWQDEYYNYTIQIPEDEDITGTDIRPLLKGTVTDKEAIKSILRILKEEHTKLSANDNYLSDYDIALRNSGLINDYPPLMSEYGVYDLRIIFSDGSDLISDRYNLDIFMQKDFFYLNNICHKGDTIYYSLENSDYDELTEIIKSSLL